MPIYYAQVDGRSEIKIGFCKKPERRLIGLQTAHVADVRFIRILDGSAADELSLHRRFQHLRVRGEWFTPCPEMLGDVGLAELPIPPVGLQILRGQPQPAELVAKREASRMRRWIAEAPIRAANKARQPSQATA